MDEHLPPLPEWSKRDDLGNLVPSEVRQALNNHARKALKAQAAEIERLRVDAERNIEIGWKAALHIFSTHGASGWSTHKKEAIDAAMRQGEKT